VASRFDVSATTSCGSSSYNSSACYTISAIRDYPDSGSFFSSTRRPRRSALFPSTTLFRSGSCGSYGSATTISSRATPIAQSLSGPNCYLYTPTGTDNVGNTISISTTVKVDTSGPSAPAVSLSGASGNTYVSGTTAYINAQAGKSGSFQAAATSSDGDSGILKLNFPSPSGFTSGGGDSSSKTERATCRERDYVCAAGVVCDTKTNNATLTNTNSYTNTPDNSNHSNCALTVKAITATCGHS